MSSAPVPAEAPARPRRAIRVLAALIVVAVSLLIAVLLGELVVRLAAPQQLILIRPDLWMPADTVGWLRRPNASGSINTGERTVHVFTDKDSYRVGQSGRSTAKAQVLLLGDSFMEALQVEYEQTVGHLLEKALSDRLGRPVAVRNAGVAGWNPNHYLLRTRQLLSRDTFALVIVPLFVGNDAVPYRFDRIPPREPVARHPLRLPRRMAWSEFVQALLAPVNDALEVRSHLYVLAKNQFATSRMRLGITADYLPLEYRRSEARSSRWRNTAELSRELARTAAARGTPVLFVLIPEHFQVYPDEFRRYVRGFSIDSTTVDVDQPTRLLLQELRAESLRVVDALPAMRAAAESGGARLYGTVDQHLSSTGHEVLARVIGAAVQPLLRR